MRKLAVYVLVLGGVLATGVVVRAWSGRLAAQTPTGDGPPFRPSFDTLQLATRDTSYLSAAGSSSKGLIDPPLPAESPSTPPFKYVLQPEPFPWTLDILQPELLPPPHVALTLDELLDKAKALQVKKATIEAEQAKNFAQIKKVLKEQKQAFEDLGILSEELTPGRIDRTELEGGHPRR